MPAPSSNVYSEFKAELDQIMKHKWLLSEQEKRDVGFERALNDWARSHRAIWRRERSQNTPKAKA